MYIFFSWVIGGFTFSKTLYLYQSIKTITTVSRDQILKLFNLIQMYNKHFVPLLKCTQTSLKYHHEKINIYLELIPSTKFFGPNYSEEFATEYS